jgi:hypothetical protein
MLPIAINPKWHVTVVGQGRGLAISRRGFADNVFYDSRRLSRVTIMRAFVISINGVLVCTAGIPVGVLTAMVMKVGATPNCSCPVPEFLLNVGGLDTRTNQHVEWKVPDIQLGDEITVKIVELQNVDPEHHADGCPGTIPSVG